MTHTPELSRIVDLDKQLKLNPTYTIKPTDAECKMLAERFGFSKLTHFFAECTIAHMGNKNIDYKITGKVVASLSQPCITTLKEVPEEINDTFDFRVVHPKQREEFEQEAYEYDDIEFSEDGIIDLGEIAAQYLCLSVNPYPRADEVVAASKQQDAPVVKKNPFLVLQQLKK